MKTVLIFALTAALIIVGAIVFKSRVAPPAQIVADQIPAVLQALAASDKSPAFAVLMFTTPGAPNEDDRLEVQYAVENGKLGFDWLLVAPQNTKDQGRFADFAAAHGYQVIQQERNHVRYLRVENGDLAALGRDILLELYKRPANQPIAMVTEGFDWKP